MKKSTLFTLLMALLIALPGMSWGQDRDAWTENFDDEHSGSYGSDPITINGRDWTRSDAGNFAYANTNMGSYAFTINDDKSNAHITSPELNTCGTVGFKYAFINGSSTNVFVLQKSTNGTDWTDLETHTLGDASNESYVDYSYDVNDASASLYIRILSDDQNAHLFIDDYYVTNFAAATDPVITNITQTPDADITSATTVSVSADITSAAGVVGGEVQWGTASGVYGDNIGMSGGVGNTYTTDTDIPAQADGTTVYYVVYALDMNGDENTSAEQSYTVADPDPNALYVVGDFNAWTQLEAYKMILGADGIYTCTGTVGVGADIEYKIRKGDDYSPGDNYTIAEVLVEEDITFYGNATLQAYHIAPKVSGNFIDQLGGTNWTPSDAAGTMNGPDDAGVFTFSGYLTAGDYAFKVTFNDVWTNATPSSNYEFNHATTGYVEITYDFVNNTIAVAEPTWTVPFNEDFETVTANSDLSLLGWTNANVEVGGVPVWLGKEYSANKYAQAASYGSTSTGADQIWMITPPINMDATTNEEFSFDINVGYWTHAGLSVKISTDYDQTIAGIATATWTDVTANFTIPVIPTGGYGTFETAGTMDVSAYNGTMSIAFVYDGNKTDGETTTYQIDNVLVEEPAAPPATSTWTGTTNNDWATATNWDNGVPGATTDVTIPAGLTNYPTISAAASANTIAIAEGATLLGSENLTLTGDATFTQSLSGGADVYHMISAPVFEPTAISVFPATSFVRSYDETTTNWVNLTGADPLEKAVGYSLNIPEAGDHPITYTGALNTATVSSGALSLTGAIVGYSGWHLLGNPFAAALEYSAGTWNETSVENFVNVWSGVQYLTSDSDLPSNIIPVGQAFFVKATVAGGSIDIPLDACVHNSTSVYKENRTNYFALNITNDANSYSDNTFVRFGQAYANEYDAQDATKMYGLAAAPQIYTMEAEHKLKINSRRSAESIDLNFEAGVEATYTFTVSEFSIDGKVMLEDKVNDITVELEGASTYEFTAMPSDPANRFVLHFDGLTAVEDMALEGINVYAANDVIYVNNAASEAAEITVFSITGQEIMSTTAAQGLNSLRINGASGNYLVQVKNASGIMTEKVFVQ